MMCLEKIYTEQYSYSKFWYTVYQKQKVFVCLLVCLYVEKVGIHLKYLKNHREYLYKITENIELHLHHVYSSL